MLFPPSTLIISNQALTLSSSLRISGQLPEVSQGSHQTSVLFEARYDYDISELELLGQIAIDLKVQNHALVKQLFLYLVSLAGHRGFAEECATLSQLLSYLQSQISYRGEFCEWHQAQLQFAHFQSKYLQK